MSELKNCPFCGSEDTARLLYNDRADVERCRNCNLSIVVPFGFTMWNNRPIEDALHTRIAELEEELRWLPVSERLPGKNFDEDWKSYDTVVQYVEQKPFLTICNYQDGKWFDIDEDYRDITRWVTHWRERPDLPEPPEDK